MRLAREFEASEGPDLGAFLDYLDSAARRSRDREAEAATRAEGHAGVRVMTVHSAKGLEFEVVAVADLGRNLQLGWTPAARRRRPRTGPTAARSARVGVQLGRLGRPGRAPARLLRAHRAGRRARRRGGGPPRLRRGDPRQAAAAAQRDVQPEGAEEAETDPAQADRPAADPLAARRRRTEREIEIAGRGRRLPGRTPARQRQRARAGCRRRAARGSATPSRRRMRPPTPSRPCGRPAGPAGPVGGLSYSALSDYEDCGYRFYVERVLGIAEPRAAMRPMRWRRGRPRPEVRSALRPRPRGPLAAGVERRNRWREPSDERSRRRAARAGPGGRAPTERPTCSELARRLARARSYAGEIGDATASPEVPFVLSVGGTLIRGSIDLLVERPDGSVLVVDYKTDRLDGRDPKRDRVALCDPAGPLRARRRGPRRCRSRPPTSSWSGPRRRCARRFGEAELEAARDRVEALLGRLAAGEFDVTHQPTGLCHRLSARERLCATARRMRDDPALPVYPIAQLTMRRARDPEAEMSLLMKTRPLRLRLAGPP